MLYFIGNDGDFNRVSLLNRPPNYSAYDSDTELDAEDFEIKVGDIVDPDLI